MPARLLPPTLRGLRELGTHRGPCLEPRLDGHEGTSAGIHLSASVGCTAPENLAEQELKVLELTQLPLSLPHTLALPCGHFRTRGISVTFCAQCGSHSLSHSHLDPCPVFLGQACATEEGGPGLATSGPTGKGSSLALPGRREDL